MPINIKDLRSGQDFYFGNPPERFRVFGSPSLDASTSTWRVKVTKIGCGLAGFSSDEIAPMFDVEPNL